MDVAMMKALQNHIVVKNIIERLNFDELQACRLVNHKWNAISSKVMQDRELCKIYIIYDNNSHAFLKYSAKTSEQVDKLAALVDLMNNSRNFPCTNFTFQVPFSNKDYQVWNEHTEVQEFFRAHGSSILTLTLKDCPPRRKDMLDILTQYSPNIENLCLQYVSFGCNEIESNEHDLYLPALKVLRWDGRCCEELISKILEGSPNLNRAIFPGDHYLKNILKLGKAYAVKELSCANQISNPQHLLEFAQANPKLEKLTFKWYPPLCSRDMTTTEQKSALLNSLRTLLETSRHTLTELDFSGAAFTNEIPLPDLPSLSTLRHPCYSCFPLGTDLIRTFPILQTLDLSGMRAHYKGHNEDFLKCFPEAPALFGNLPSVQVVEISEDRNEAWMEELYQRLCPNFKKLVVHLSDQASLDLLLNIHTSGQAAEKGKTGHHPLLGMFARIFRLWQHLESIKIKGVTLGMCDLDPVLTGLSTEDCDLLYNSYEERACSSSFISEPKAVANLKAADVSIASLQGLKNLVFVFNAHSGSRVSKPVTNKFFLFSRVSCLHAFKLLPELKVSIVQHKEMSRHEGADSVAESIFPFVQFLWKSDIE